jgi:plastocyanin
MTLMDSLLEVAAIFVQPDWDLIRSLFPVLLLVLFVAWFAWTTRKYATLGPTRRAPARVQPVTPPHVHMPGGSVAPILVALGAGALFAGLILGGIWLALGAVALVVTLIVWFREAVRDYAHLEPSGKMAARQLPAVVHDSPPPGVHMPGPSIRPLMGALGSAALLGGLVVGGWVLILAVVFLVYTLIGWLVDFTAEYRKVEEADATGHLENIPARALPARPLQVFAVLFVLAGMWQAGILPPSSTDAGGPGASPGASGPPTGSPGPGGGELVVVAREVAFDKRELTVQADAPFAITLNNEDPATLPHDIDIRQGPGAPTLQDQATVPGGQSAQYSYEPLSAGTYQFFCSVHPGVPAMEGTLTVQ